MASRPNSTYFQPPRIGGIFGGIREKLACDAPNANRRENQLKIGQFAGRLAASSGASWCNAGNRRRLGKQDLDVAICKAYASLASDRIEGQSLKRARTGKVKSVASKSAARSISSGVARRASIFRNGANQAVRLPQEMRFPTDVKEVRIRKQGDGLVITPVKPNWASFFALQAEVPDDFLEDRSDSHPQPRDPL